MDYFSFDASGQMQAQRYTAKGIRLIRTGTGNPDEPIHVIGGIANSMTAAETRGFLNAVHAEHDRRLATSFRGLHHYIHVSQHAQMRKDKIAVDKRPKTEDKFGSARNC